MYGLRVLLLILVLLGKSRLTQKAMEDNQFDITEALKTRKPLRRTTKPNLMGSSGDGAGGMDKQLQNQLKGRKLSTIEQGQSNTTHHSTYTASIWRSSAAFIINVFFKDSHARVYLYIPLLR